jgi:mannosyltransferase OCH1-like enzyme
MDSLMAVLEEGAPDAERTTPPERTIPRILHRTVPKLPTQEVQDFWTTAIRLHPDWIHMDHREPLEPGEYPETGRLWKRCSSGAQKAGLIRLEVLWSHGGVYIDSDVELYRSLEPLLDLQGFAAWEDRKVCPDAVMGFKRHHPAVRAMLDEAVRLVQRGQGAWETGPGVTTRNLPGREDVLLLPPGSFYPYHYKEKHRRSEDHATEQPWAFGAHHWAHSWAGN